MALVSSLQVDTSATYKVPWRQLLEAILMSTKSNTEQIKNNNNSVLHIICSDSMNVQFMLELYSLDIQCGLVIVDPFYNVCKTQLTN